MNVQPTQLSFALWKLTHGRRFVWSRWGDGEIFCMLGKQGKNSNGCTFTPELGEALRAVVIRQQPYFWACRIRQNAFVDPSLDVFFKQHNVTHPWYDQGVFARANRAGKLKPVVDWLRSVRLLYVGPQHLEKIAVKLFGDNTVFVTVPDRDSWEHRDSIMASVRQAIANFQPEAIGLSTGLFAKVLLDWIYPECSAHIIDFGSIWDIYAGVSSRGTYRKRYHTPEWFWAMNVDGTEPPPMPEWPDIKNDFGVGGTYMLRNILFVARIVDKHKLVLAPLRRIGEHENPKFFTFIEQKEGTGNAE